MAVESPAASSGGRVLPRVKLGTIIAISIFWFALNYHWIAVQSVLLQDQVNSLLLREAPVGPFADQVSWVKDHRALSIALVLAPGLIVALLANPFFGLLSDRTRGRFGRRKPYILIGTAFNIGTLLLMAYGPKLGVIGHSGNALAPSILILMGALMLTQVASNAVMAPFHALLPDMVPQEQRGLASGVMGFAQLFGTIGGVIGTGFFGMNSVKLLDGTQSIDDYDGRLKLAYLAICVVIGVLALITVFTVHERVPSSAAASEGAGQMLGTLGITVVVVVLVSGGMLFGLQMLPSIGLTDKSLSVVQLVGVLLATYGAARAFEFKPRRTPDFSWVVATRGLVNTGIYIVLNFLIYYLGDVAHAPSAENAFSSFITILSVTAVATTILAGWLSDRIGRKRMVYISGAFMAVVGAVFIVAPYVVKGDLMPVVLGAAAIFGLGYGAYVAVDWALVADTLPSDETFARDMGVWNISLTTSQVISVVLGGWLLTIGTGLVNTSFGYVLLFAGFVVFCVAGTVTVRYIRGVKS